LTTTVIYTGIIAMLIINKSKIKENPRNLKHAENVINIEDKNCNRNAGMIFMSSKLDF
jgi:hypothetical protein